MQNIIKNDETHVLIVDDSVTTRNVIKKYLGSNYMVHHASNGEEAWQLIQSEENISLVFADLHMPVMNGMLLLKQIRSSDCRRVSNLPVIIITGHEDNDAAKKASFNIGATDYISKPFSELDVVTRANSYSNLNKKIVELETRATSDDSVDLLNNKGFHILGEKSIANAYRHKLELSILVMQAINADSDITEHYENISIEMIQTIIETLKKSLRKEEELAHLGSGRIAILLPMTKAFKAHIVAMRFRTAVAKLVFKHNGERIKLNLAIGLNSLANQTSSITINEFQQQTEKALEVSLHDGGKLIVRHDEIIDREEYRKDQTALSPDQSIENRPQAINADVPDNQTTDSQPLDTRHLCQHFQNILNGDYNNIPNQHIINMIEPLESILKYAHKQRLNIAENTITDGFKA